MRVEIGNVVHKFDKDNPATIGALFEQGKALYNSRRLGKLQVNAQFAADCTFTLMKAFFNNVFVLEAKNDGSIIEYIFMSPIIRDLAPDEAIPSYQCLIEKWVNEEQSEVTWKSFIEEQPKTVAQSIAPVNEKIQEN